MAIVGILLGQEWVEGMINYIVEIKALPVELRKNYWVFYSFADSRQKGEMKSQRK